MVDLEGQSYLEDSFRDNSLEESPRLSDSQIDYIQEVLPIGNAEIIASRIDELSDSFPPKAINSVPEIASLIIPVEDCIDSKYLEAPNDLEQVEMISDSMLQIEGTDYSTWKQLSLDDKEAVLQEIEYVAAEYEHRPACRVEFKPLGNDADAEYGHYNSRFSPEMTRDEYAEASQEQPVITINSDLIDGSFTSYQETMDTIIHEGRHAYQEYNLYEREVHTSVGDLTNWKVNEFGYRYQNYVYCGEKLYWMQPLEADARKFAEDVITKFNQKV